MFDGCTIVVGSGPDLPPESPYSDQRGPNVWTLQIGLYTLNGAMKREEQLISSAHNSRQLRCVVFVRAQSSPVQLSRPTEIGHGAISDLRLKSK